MTRPVAPPLSHRREGLRALGAGLALATLAACGFRWRGAYELAFERIALLGFAPRSPLGKTLRDALGQSGRTRVVGLDQAQVVLRALGDQREKVVVASTTAGQVRELELRVRFSFSLGTVRERELLPPAELLQTRLLSYVERDALAKEQEEAELYRAMQNDIVQQVMRRLAALRDIA